MTLDPRSPVVVYGFLLAVGVEACGGQAPGAESPATAPATSAVPEETTTTALASPASEGPASSDAAAPGSPEPPPASEPSGVVEIAPPKVTGKLSGDPSVEHMIHGTRTGLSTCYQRALRDQPDAAGAAVFQIAVTDSGAIQKVTSTNPPGLPGSVTACMVGRFGALAFKAAGASTIEVTVTCKSGP